MLGNEHSDTLRAMSSLAVTYRSLDKMAEAIELEMLLRVSQGSDKATLEEPHPRHIANVRGDCNGH
jgi:hypothetical protein